MYNYNKIIETLVSAKARKTTQFISDKFIIRAVRKTYKKKDGKRMIPKGNIEIILTIGKPNYAEREYIKLCKKAGESFPIKKMPLKF